MCVSGWAPLAFKKASGHLFLQKTFMEEAIHWRKTKEKCTYKDKAYLTRKTVPELRKLNEQICNECYNIKSKIDCESGKLLVLWTDNASFRVLTNLCLNWADRILRCKKSLDKFGYIDVRTINRRKIQI